MIEINISQFAGYPRNFILVETESSKHKYPEKIKKLSDLDIEERKTISTKAIDHDCCAVYIHWEKSDAGYTRMLSYGYFYTINE